MSVCGDNSCMFGPPGGMGTNGGCRCLIDVEQRLRLPIRARVAALREVERWARGTKRCQLCHTNHVNIEQTGGVPMTVERHQDDCPLSRLDALRAEGGTT